MTLNRSNRTKRVTSMRLLDVNMQTSSNKTMILNWSKLLQIDFTSVVTNQRTQHQQCSYQDLQCSINNTLDFSPETRGFLEENAAATGCISSFWSFPVLSSLLVIALSLRFGAISNFLEIEQFLKSCAFPQKVASCLTFFGKKEVLWELCIKRRCMIVLLVYCGIFLKKNNLKKWNLSSHSSLKGQTIRENIV
jgi:hypothetical protein